MNSSIEINIIGTVPEAEVIIIQTVTGGAGNAPWVWRFVETRNGPFQVTSSYSFQQSVEFYNAALADIGSTGHYNVTISGSTIIITAHDQNVTFIQPTGLPPGVTAIVNNEEEEEEEGGIGSTVDISFENVMGSGHVFTLEYRLAGNTTSWGWDFVSNPNEPFEVSVAAFNPSEQGLNFYNAVLADIGSDLFDVTFLDGITTITANDSGVTFHEVSSPNGMVVAIENAQQGTTFEVADTFFSAATNNRCDNVRVRLLTNVEADGVFGDNLSNVTITSSDVSFDVPRSGIWHSVTLAKDDVVINHVFTLPEVLTDTIDVNVVNSPHGGTATIVRKEGTRVTQILNLSYSLDNVNFQDSNVFTDLDPGTYTAFVKDEFGCWDGVPFTVIESNSVGEGGFSGSYFYISKSNSIRFALRTSDVFKSEKNALSHESSAMVTHKETQIFTPKDFILTQFKSNYNNHEIRVIMPSKEQVITPTKISDYLQKKDRRDCYLFDYENGQTGVYFTQGNIYDYDSGDVDEQYDLNGSLPEWGVLGNYFFINGWHEIVNIAYSEEYNANVLVINATYNSISGAQQPSLGQVSAVYDLFNYEIYEFEIDPTDFEDEPFCVEIKAIGENILTYESERIMIKDLDNTHVRIHYKNSTNTDIYYESGILHVLYVLLDKISGNIEDETETHKTDDTALLTKTTIHEVDEFTLGPMTKGIMNKVVKALSHDTVFINSQQYVKNSVSTEGAIEESNLYFVTANMIKIDNVYDAELYSGETPMLPPLLNDIKISDDGYLKI